MSRWLIDQVWQLWLVTAIIVAVASVIHYLWSTSDRTELREKSEHQRRMPKPRDRSESSRRV
jgi:hypothetical protein